MIRKISLVGSIHLRWFGTGKKGLKGKTGSSTRWLQRQKNDHYVQMAKKQGWRSRAALKLLEINQKHKVIQPGNVVVDLGAAPGGWAQVAANASKAQEATNGIPRVIAVDLLHISSLEGVHLIQGDLRKADIRKQIDESLNGRAVNVVLSDMAPSFTGQFAVDSESQMRLCQNALRFAGMYLATGGNFLVKYFSCDGVTEFRDTLREQFGQVMTIKPAASRSESSEMYFLAKNYKGSD